MNMKELASAIAKAEGLKKSITIGNAREVLALISDAIYLDETSGDSKLIMTFFNNGKRRAKKKKK